MSPLVEFIGFPATTVTNSRGIFNDTSRADSGTVCTFRWGKRPREPARHNPARAPGNVRDISIEQLGSRFAGKNALSRALMVRRANAPAGRKKLVPESA